jgi:hypothetical protein
MSLYVVTVITAVVTAVVAIPDFIPAGFVPANSTKVHVPRSWLPMLGTGETRRSCRTSRRSRWPAGHWDRRRHRPGVVFHRRSDRASSGPRSVNIAFPGAYLGLSAASLVLLAGK